MSVRTLITGCNGFVGKYLAQTLLEEGSVVVGVDLQESARDSRIDYEKVDIADTRKATEFVVSRRIDEIYHLAAVANPRECQANPEKAVNINVLGAVSLLEACRSRSECRLLIVGSSEEYSRKGGERVVFVEEDPLDSRTIYGATKICAESLGRSYSAQYGLNVFFTRSFNHTGAGQSDSYVVSSFARQCAGIAVGKQAPSIKVGNVNLERDFTDVRDVVDAYLRIMRDGTPGEAYNVASGKLVSLGAILERLIGMTGRRDVEIAAMPGLRRTDEALSVTGDITKIRKRLGWNPEIPIEETLEWMFEAWKTTV